MKEWAVWGCSFEMNRTFVAWGVLVSLAITLFAQERRVEDRLRLGQKAPAISDSAPTRKRMTLVFIPTLPDGAGCKSEIESLSRLKTLLRQSERRGHPRRALYGIEVARLL